MFCAEVHLVHVSKLVSPVASQWFLLGCKASYPHPLKNWDIAATIKGYGCPLQAIITKEAEHKWTEPLEDAG